MILIRNGRTMDPATGTDLVQDVRICGGKIVETGKNLPEAFHGIKTGTDGADSEKVADGEKLTDGGKPADDEKLTVIDAAGCVVAPGLTDTHVHFRDPGFTWKEDLMTGSRSAAHGGVTTVLCMANTSPVMDSPELLREMKERAKSCPVRVEFASSVTKGLKGRELVDMRAMAGAGAKAFTDDGIPLMDEKLLMEALYQAAELDLPVSLHEEDPLFVPGPGVNQGEISQILNYPGASAQAEEIMTARDCILALHTGARICIQHISSKRSVDLVRLAKSWGAKVSAEATPHHFTLTEQDVLKYGTNARMNPPLRTEEDRRAIIEGLKDGTIDMIVTDHAPHAPEEKNQPMEKAPSGIIGLETSLALGIRSLVQTGELSLMELLRLMSYAPAAYYALDPVRIAPGSRADLVIFKENETWTADHFVSRSGNSPFLGWTLPGKIHYTICGGRIVCGGNEDEL